MGQEPGEGLHLGEVLVESGLVTTEEIRQALASQLKSGKRLGELLVERQALCRPTLQRALAAQQGIVLEEEDGFGTGLRAAIKRSHDERRAERASLLAMLSQ